MDKDQILLMDAHILLSFINTKLRDEFESISSLCSYYDIKEEDIKYKLEKIDYTYDTNLNQFK
ncbi:DUF4250 domain-containing protein [Clostridium sp. JS66]|uniref:DUF4250 domain-containing protein n=1 Tax=Clostridium sp. JS66 TaxID=3064705 RepID=UPI00298DEF34|nr:DUF4250 domain-containing protein [Clostridium sp. JS66]WPC44045.1 DUF4250 domain-containing protein [Clostridium sp. JS66]